MPDITVTVPDDVDTEKANTPRTVNSSPGITFVSPTDVKKNRGEPAATNDGLD